MNVAFFLLVLVQIIQHGNCTVDLTPFSQPPGRSDIILTKEDRLSAEVLANENDPNSPQLAVVRSERSLWPEGRVPYVLDNSLSSTARQAIQQAINDYARQTCIRFVPRGNEADYVRFYRGSG